MSPEPRRSSHDKFDERIACTTPALEAAVAFAGLIGVISVPGDFGSKSDAIYGEMLLDRYLEVG